MCIHCRQDMSLHVYGSADRAVHDGSLFPHGRIGYRGVTIEAVQAAQDACQFCNHPLLIGPGG